MSLLPRERPSVGRVVIAVGCVYELAALWTRLPTITQIVKHANRRPYLRVLAWLWGGLWSFHFFSA